MAIKTVRISKFGKDYQISEHFKLREFASKDGADLVKYSTELLALLETLRSYGGFTIAINSGYRTAAYNRAVGGASKSQHVEGTAADITVKKDGKTVDAALICCLCQLLEFPGVAYISPRSLHVDARKNGTYRGDERKGYKNNVDDFFDYFNITKAQVEALRVKTEEPKKETGENEMIYKDINEVPEWGREAVQLRLEHGWSDCKNIEHSLLRAWVTYDKENPYIADLADVEKHRAWAVDEVKALMAAGKIKGNSVEQIGKRWQVIEGLIMASR